FARVAARLRLARLRLARSRLVRGSARSLLVAPFARVAARLRLARLRLARSRLLRGPAPSLLVAPVARAAARLRLARSRLVRGSARSLLLAGRDVLVGLGGGQALHLVLAGRRAALAHGGLGIRRVGAVRQAADLLHVEQGAAALFFAGAAARAHAQEGDGESPAHGGILPVHGRLGPVEILHGVDLAPAAVDGDGGDAQPAVDEVLEEVGEVGGAERRGALERRVAPAGIGGAEVAPGG